MSNASIARFILLTAVSLLVPVWAGGQAPSSAKMLRDFEEGGKSPIRGNELLLDYDLIEKRSREAYELDPGRRQAIEEKKKIVSIPEPVLAPNGDRIVAKVNDRYMTMGDLNLRLNIYLRNSLQEKPLGAREQQEFMEELRTEVSYQILEEWVMNAVLSLEAERQKYSVTGAEVQQSLQDLASNSAVGPQKAQQAARMIGVPQDQLMAEAHDGLLIDKFIMDIVRKSYTEEDYKRAYELQPSYFLIPPRVRAFHIFRAVDGSMTEKRQKEIVSDLEKIRKELKKKNPNLESLAAKSDTNSQVAVGDMGWVTADSPLPPEVIKALFSLEPGETSQIFKTNLRTGRGFHIVRVLEREEGSKFSFEDAIPQIEDWLFEKMKLAVYDLAKQSYEIQMNTGGINRWKEIPREQAAATSPTEPATPIAPQIPVGRSSPGTSALPPPQ